MRYFVRLSGAICCALGLWSSISEVQACGGLLEEDDKVILDCTELVRAGKDVYFGPLPVDLGPGGAYRVRGFAYLRKGDYDAAIADYNESLRRSLTDLGSKVVTFEGRGKAFFLKGDYNRAIIDYDECVRFSPRNAFCRGGRGEAYAAKGDWDRAIADYTEALMHSPVHQYYAGRGNTYRRMGDHDRALADLNEAVRTTSEWATAEFAIAYSYRGQIYEAKGERSKAIEDYSKFLTFSAKTKWEKDEHSAVAKRLAALQAAPPEPAPTAVAPPLNVVPVGRRVALVIGNAAYRVVAPLPNPSSDARAVASALRAAGFAEVVEHHDLGAQQMRDALKAFEEKAIGADWAVVYYAGHGIEVDGRNFLIPVDAVLKSASDVEDETVPLDRVMARVAVAKRLQLVILDACRDNPFAPRMTQPGTVKRTVGARGLARIEPEHPNLFIAYSARHGEAALDGAGKNSPYARALVKYLAVPNIALNTFFIRVRAEVLAETSGKQRPFEYGSLTDENLFFRPTGK